MDVAVATGLIKVFSFLFNAIFLLIFFSVVISWLDANPDNPIVRAVHTMTEPLYRLVRPLTRRIPVPLDLAPMLIMLILIFLQQTILHWLMMKARGA